MGNEVLDTSKDETTLTLVLYKRRDTLVVLVVEEERSTRPVKGVCVSDYPWVDF